MCSRIDPGEKGYRLLEQILFNFLVLFRDKVKCELRVACCELQVASCELRVASCKS